MPIRRTPFRGAAQGGQERGNVAGAMSMPPTPGLGGPSSFGQSPMMGQGQDQPQPMPMQPGGTPGMGMPMPPDVHAGGPTSPFNIEEMLKTNEPKMQGGGMAMAPPPPAVPASPVRRTLQPWGDSAGTQEPQSPSQYGGASDVGQPGAEGQPQPQAPGMGDVGGGMAPMVMLRLLKSLGRI